MAVATVSFIVLVIFAIVVVPILIRVFGEAVSRNENREDEGEDRGSNRHGK